LNSAVLQSWAGKPRQMSTYSRLSIPVKASENPGLLLHKHSSHLALGFWCPDLSQWCTVQRLLAWGQHWIRPPANCCQRRRFSVLVAALLSWQQTLNTNHI
jgi:hypothetical protein